MQRVLVKNINQDVLAQAVSEQGADPDDDPLAWVCVSPGLYLRVYFDESDEPYSIKSGVVDFQPETLIVFSLECPGEILT